MAQISKILGLGKKQPELDFVDIDLSTDTPLFLDPAAFYQGEGAFAENCSKDLEEFFDAVLHAAGTEDWNLGLRLLKGLQEPDEIFLGFSTGRPRGRGIGEIQAVRIFDAILKSRAVESGLIRDLNDAFMFLPGVGPDKVSDITTNILRRHLITYTQQQMELHGVDVTKLLPTGLLWDPVQADWTENYDEIPFIDNKKVLLVPKRFVKYAKNFTRAGQRYYDGFISNFIRQREMSTLGRLVKFREKKDGTKTPIVYKEDIEREVPRHKNSVSEFTLKHPELYDKFKAAFFKHDPTSVNAIMSAQSDNFRESDYVSGAIKALKALAPGTRYATDYQHLILGIIHYLFYPNLTNPVLERPINDGRKRIDISFDNSSSRGVFSRLRQDPFLVAREVMIECKNYSHDIKNPELDQLIGRFDDRRGRFGILTCRTVEDRSTLLTRCTDAFQANQGVVIVLSDADIIFALEGGFLGRESRVEDIVTGQLQSLRS